MSVELAASPKRSVAILMATYNGECFLKEQLDSILEQSWDAWKLYVSDDGSCDATMSILLRYQEKFGSERFTIFAGPQKGFAQNFLSLIRRQEVQGDYYAFCDQDDIWHVDKLQKSLAVLSAIPADVPAIYCARTRLVDELGRGIGFSPLFPRVPSFRNALVQSVAGANTMTINGAAREILALIPESAEVVSHDWMAYLLISGSGGQVFYDPEPTVDYRQHGANLIGSNSSLCDRLVRLRKMLHGTFRKWNDLNIGVLAMFRERLSADSMNALDCFEAARDASFFNRFFLLKRSGVYRQTRLGNIGLLVASWLKRL